jgi:hypothetical protein
MLHEDYSGARGSNAGDDFHELWALRQALALLEYDTEFAAMSVEGLKANDERDPSAFNWAGVDCALYYGGDTAASAKRIEIVQLKYSGADPQLPWTISRLTKNNARTRNNSPMRRLADAYKGLVNRRNGSRDGVSVHFISNQPMGAEVIASLQNDRSAVAVGRTKLRKASGLSASEFSAFTQALNLGEQSSSRFAIQATILQPSRAGWRTRHDQQLSSS